MNAVATPPKTSRAPRAKAAAPAQPPVPAWATLLDAIKQDLSRVHSIVAEVAEELLGDEGEIVVLLDMATAHIGEAHGMLVRGQPTQALTDNVFYALGKPLALLLGAAAMTRELEVDIFSDTIVRAHSMLDECQDNLDSQAIGKLMPESCATTPAEVASTGQADDAEAWRELAFDANFEIQKLAEGMQIINEALGNEDHPMVHGIMARINTLTTIVFLAARLYPGPPEDWGSPTLDELRGQFKGNRP